jgi:hypothetical protein
METTAIPARAAAAYPAMLPTLGPSSGVAVGEGRPEDEVLAGLVVRVTVNCLTWLVVVGVNSAMEIELVLVDVASTEVVGTTDVVRDVVRARVVELVTVAATRVVGGVEVVGTSSSCFLSSFLSSFVAMVVAATTGVVT